MDLRASPSDDPTVRSVRRAFAILRSFGPSDLGLPLGEVARRSNLDKATTRRILRTLINERLIEQRHPNRDYSLALGVLSLSAGATPADELRRRAQPLLASVAETTGATSFILISHDGAAMCIETRAGDMAAPPPVSVGKRLPFNISPAPRILLAFMPAEQRARLLARPFFPALTPRTPTDPDEVAERLDAIRARGWDTSQGHVMEGVWGLGVAIRDAAGEVIAALGIAGSDAQMMAGGEPRLLQLVLQHVRDWEMRFGPPVRVPPSPRPGHEQAWDGPFPFP